MLCQKTREEESKISAQETDLLKRIPAPLLKWYEENRRILPWREIRNPYYTWVSEIMLQQTRVEAVKPYFQRFIQALPDPAALAACPEDQLLKLWEGLGYYNRVRNMQKAARVLTERYGGRLPEEPAELKKLPGIGSYTAGAIASIAYGRAAAAVDGNVLRILARLREDAREISRESVRKAVEAEVTAILPQNRAGQFNQALMDLGATICLPNGEPLCGKCPLYEICQAAAHGRAEEYPVKQKKKPRRVEQRTILLIRDGDRTVLRQRARKGLLAGLYEFPNLEGRLSEQEALNWVEDRDFLPLQIRPLPEAVHIFSHIEWQMIGYEIRIAAFEGGRTEQLILAEPAQLRKQYPVPAAYSAYLKCL